MNPRYFVHGKTILGTWYVLDRQQPLDHAADDARTGFAIVERFPSRRLARESAKTLNSK
jgi:hypothetical protein